MRKKNIFFNFLPRTAGNPSDYHEGDFTLELWDIGWGEGTFTLRGSFKTDLVAEVLISIIYLKGVWSLYLEPF